MQPFRKSPQHNTSTSTAFNESTILEHEEEKMPFFYGLREIAKIQDKVFRLQDKVEHPALYCTQQDAEAGSALLRNMVKDLSNIREQLENKEIDQKLEVAKNEIRTYKSMFESQKLRYKRVEEKLVRFGYTPPEGNTELQPAQVVPDSHASFLTDHPVHTHLPIISPIPDLTSCPQRRVDSVIAPLVATPELFRKLSKGQSRAGAEHVKEVMGDGDASADLCSRYEPDMVMSLAGPIRAERQIPPPLAESPACVREFKFPTTPTQSYFGLGELNVEASGSSIGDPVTFRQAEPESDDRVVSVDRKETSDLVTEAQYQALPIYIVNNITLLELNAILARFRKLAPKLPDLSEMGVLSERLADEVGSDPKWNLVKLALLRLKLIQSVGEAGAAYIIH